MNNKNGTKVKINKIKIENKEVWDQWSANDLYDMYVEISEDGEEFSIHAKGIEKKDNK